MAGVVRSLGRCLWPAAGGDPEAAAGPVEPGKEGGLLPPAVPLPPPPPSSSSLRRRELEREARRRSREIDALLARERRAVRRLVRILLLGAGESGKSTFLKQMRIIHGREFDQKALLEFRATIYENALKVGSPRGLLSSRLARLATPPPREGLQEAPLEAEGRRGIKGQPPFPSLPAGWYGVSWSSRGSG